MHAGGGADVYARAQVALSEGDFERAYADARDAGARDEQPGRPNPACAGWRGIASHALAHLGRREEASALADAELALAEAFGAPVTIARAMLARAVSEPDKQARISICRRALASLGASRAGAELESVRLRLELGSTLARLGRRIEARELLRPGLPDADAVGASQLAERAHGPERSGRRPSCAVGTDPARQRPRHERTPVPGTGHARSAARAHARSGRRFRDAARQNQGISPYRNRMRFGKLARCRSTS